MTHQLLLQDLQCIPRNTTLFPPLSLLYFAPPLFRVAPQQEGLLEEAS